RSSRYAGERRTAAVPSRPCTKSSPSSVVVQRASARREPRIHVEGALSRVVQARTCEELSQRLLVPTAFCGRNPRIRRLATVSVRLPESLDRLRQGRSTRLEREQSGRELRPLLHQGETPLDVLGGVLELAVRRAEAGVQPFRHRAEARGDF